MLDSIDNDDGDEVDDLINVSDTEVVSNKPLDSGHSVLAPKVSIYVTNLEISPDGNKQNKAKEKMRMKK